jgi:hypothetical protein
MGKPRHPSFAARRGAAGLRNRLVDLGHERRAGRLKIAVGGVGHDRKPEMQCLQFCLGQRERRQEDGLAQEVAHTAPALDGDAASDKALHVTIDRADGDLKPGGDVARQMQATIAHDQDDLEEPVRSPHDSPYRSASLT